MGLKNKDCLIPPDPTSNNQLSVTVHRFPNIEVNVKNVKILVYCIVIFALDTSISTSMISLPAIIAFLAVVLCFLIRILNLTDRVLMPETFDSGSDFVKAVKASCPFLKEKYVPPVWARSGHMQTLFASQVGRVNPPTLLGKHHTVKMKDGATMTFDVYEPEMTKSEEKLNTIIIVPGIGNCSDTKYVRTFAGYALKHNFRVAVLDHLGVRENIRLTSPRIFTYGSTDELRVLVKQVIARYNCHHLIGVGFSMGANVLLKYLGEKPERQKNFTCAISVCQGYDIISASQLFCDWEGARRFYSFVMAQNMKALILRNEHILFKDPEMCVQKADVCNATSLNELDEAFNRRMAHFDDTKTFYEENSSCTYMSNIKMPVLLLNARDDPIIPEPLYASPLKHIEENPQALFVLTKHGGHLGYYEGGLFGVSEITWMDKSILQYILAAISISTISNFSKASKS